MKKTIFFLLLPVLLNTAAVSAQTDSLPQSFLFDDSDVVAAPDNKSVSEAVNSARDLLNQKPTQLRQKSFPKLKSKNLSSSTSKVPEDIKEAPFGLVWGASIIETRNRGVQLSSAEMKDYVNSFLATKLPKPIAFFEKVYVVYGKENELYRILAYSQKIDDDASASKVLQQYTTFSELLNKKYGNKQEDFTPAVINVSKNVNGKDETIEENAPIGNPNFLEQLQNGTAVLFSTYYNKDVAAALSIGVDGDKKSYIVIDYKNLRILEKQQAKTLDAL